MNDDIAALLDRHDVKSVHRFRSLDQISVVLIDGRMGKGETWADAVAQAERPDAENVYRSQHD